MKSQGTCDSLTNCTKPIALYCPDCNILLCRTCHCSHDDKSHLFPVSYHPNEECLKVVCEKHAADALFMCTEPCNNTFICIYCCHREHNGHKIDTIQNQTEKNKASIKEGVRNIGAYNAKLDSMLQQVESDISVARYVLDETLMYRKMLCITEYFHFLNKDEERVSSQFYSITVKHREQYRNKESFYKMLTRTQDSLLSALQMKHVLDQLSVNGGYMNITEEIIALNGHNFNAANPLGSLFVERGRGIVVDEAAKSFKSRLVNMGDHSTRSDAMVLYENLLFLLQKGENFQGIFGSKYLFFPFF